LAIINRYNGSQRCIKLASPQENVIVCTLLIIDTHESFVALKFMKRCRDVHTFRLSPSDFSI